MQQVKLDDAKEHLGDLIEAAVRGDEVVITKEDRPVAKLVPVAGSKAQPKFGSAKVLITMSDDFDEPIEDFGEYMKCSPSRARPCTASSPWTRSGHGRTRTSSGTRPSTGTGRRSRPAEPLEEGAMPSPLCYHGT